MLRPVSYLPSFPMVALVISQGMSKGSNETILCDRVQRKTHLQVTSHVTRDESIHKAKVVDNLRISPTVRKIILKLLYYPTSSFSFRPGQWVDFHIPGVPEVGGFSIASTPETLKISGTIELAVKYSECAPAKWVHSQVGCEVSIRLGGNFFLHDITEDCKILFIAGGVGINPLASMILHMQDLDRKKTRKNKSALLFSGKEATELIFKKNFDEYAKAYNFFPRYFVTTAKNSSSENGPIEYGRIKEQDIQSALRDIDFSSLKPKETQVYVCGPPGFMTDMEKIVQDVGIPNVRHELWW